MGLTLGLQLCFGAPEVFPKPLLVQAVVAILQSERFAHDCALPSEARQQGVQEDRRNTIENLLRLRFETLDEALAAIIQPIIALSSPEYSSLLLQLSNLSREELLARFGQ